MTRTAVSVTGIAPPRAYYSHAISAGDVVYVAGQVPVDAAGQVVDGDAEAQARQVMENLAAVVAAAGATLDDVVKTTVYLTDRAHRAAVGKVRQEYFSDPPPANTLLVVAGLAEPEMMVEIEAIVVPGS
jgi:2-iminobutanoate/2-iminopropanoate deaminase